MQLLRLLQNERDGVSADGFAAPDSAQAFAGFGFDAYLRGLEAECSGNSLLHAGNMRSEFWLFEADGSIDIDNQKAGFTEQFANVPKEQEAGSVAPAW